MIRPLALILSLFLGLGGCMPQQPKVSWPIAEYDSEFLYWCAEDDGYSWPVHIEAPECEEGVEVSRGQWDHFPIIVNTEDEYLRETMEAINAMNAQLGFKLFELDGTTHDPDVAIVNAGLSQWAWAEAKLYTDGRMHGAVLVYNDMGSLDRADVIMHELGHIVGLRHDKDNPMSVMYPGPNSRAAYLELQDIRALRRLYLGHP